MQQSVESSPLKRAKKISSQTLSIDLEVLNVTRTNTSVIEANISNILQGLGHDTKREGLIKTPQRYAKAMLEVTSGYGMTLENLIGDAIFDEGIDEMVIVKDLAFHSLCEHHLLPFFGKVTVGYIPDRKVLGLSKFGRIVEMYSKRLSVQERYVLLKRFKKFDKGDRYRCHGRSETSRRWCGRSSFVRH